MPDEKRINTIILDTGCIIKNDPSVSTLLVSAENLLTTPSVISEIRDQKTRARVETTLIPFLQLRTPKPESVRFVREFARRTGDLAVLSGPDVELIALTYDVECERNGGDWRLRSTPGQKRINGSPPDWLVANEHGKSEKQGDAKEQGEADEQGNPREGSESVTVAEKDGMTNAGCESNAAPTTETEESTPNDSQEKGDFPGSVSQESREDEPSQIDPSQPEASQPEASQSEASQPEASQPEALQPEVVKDEPLPDVTEPLSSEMTDLHLSNSTPSEPAPQDDLSHSTSEEDTPSPSDPDSDSEGWITPSNIKKHLQTQTQSTTTSSSSRRNPPQTTIQSALLTSDFAMQNVLLQLNLNLLSPTLQRIRHLKTFILRCHACFATTRESHRQFCPRCGKPTLTRVSCSTDGATGAFKLHLKRNMQWNTRGDRYSIPKPVAGSASGKVNVGGGGKGGGKGGWGQGLILAEDQKEYVRALTEGKRRGKGRDLMDEDFLPGLLTGERQRGGGRVKVGAGRNVNSRKRQ